MAEVKSTIEQPEADLQVQWHALQPDEVLERLGTTQQHGLSSQEAAHRLEQYGPNQLAEKPRPTFLQLVIGQLNNFLVILLIVAAVISALLGDYIEAIAIMAIVVLNAILGVIQENRAEEALAALKKLAAPEAQVLRDGHRISVPAPQLVPGDIVMLEAGNFIPADMRLFEAVNLRIDEAALTGESVPVQKNAILNLQKDIPLGDRKNTAFMGTTVSYGRGRGVIISTGMHTQLGLIADMLQNVEAEETPLQQRLEHLGKLLGWGSLAVCGLVFVVGVLRANVFSLPLNEVIVVVKDLFMVAVSLAIAAVPEGLPAVVTISLALGMREMVRRHALIRKLASVETLGSATVICSDKTGTLTQNEMTVTRLWSAGQFFEITGSGYALKGEFKKDNQVVTLNNYPAAANTLWVGVLNNDAELELVQNNGSSSYRIIGDPTEGSILVAAAKADPDSSQLNTAFPRTDEIPFDSGRKRMVTLHSVELPRPDDLSPFSNPEPRQGFAVTMKGAPDIVLDLCRYYQRSDGSVAPLDPEMREVILAANDTMTQSALRVLGLAYRLVEAKPEEISSDELEKELVFAGMVGMIDPARPEV